MFSMRFMTLRYQLRAWLKPKTDKAKSCKCSNYLSILQKKFPHHILYSGIVLECPQHEVALCIILLFQYSL